MIEENERERKGIKEKQRLSHTNSLVSPDGGRYVKFKKRSDLGAAGKKFFRDILDNNEMNDELRSRQILAKVIETVPDERKKEELHHVVKWWKRSGRFNRIDEIERARFNRIEAMKDSLSERLLDGCAYIGSGYCSFQVSIPAELRYSLSHQPSWQKNCKNTRNDCRSSHRAESNFHLSGDSSAKDLYMRETISICNRTLGSSAAIVNKILPSAEDERLFTCNFIEWKVDEKLCYNHLVFDFSTHQLVVTRVRNERTADPLEVHNCLYNSVFKFYDFDRAVDHFKVDISPILEDRSGFNHAGCECQTPRVIID